MAYVIPKKAMPDSALHRLRLHGIIVEEAGSFAVEGASVFAIDSVVRRGNPFQGHVEVRLEGAWKDDPSYRVADGAYIVRTSQPLGVLAVELLEAQSDDGLVTWNFFDASIDEAVKAGRTFAVVRATRPLRVPTRIVP